MCLGAQSLLDGTRGEAFMPFLYNYEWIWWYLYWWGGCDVWCEWFCQWINSWIAQFGHPALHRALWSGSSPVSNQFHSSQCSSQQWKMSAAFNLDSSLHHRPMVCFHCGYWAIHHQGGRVQRFLPRTNWLDYSILPLLSRSFGFYHFLYHRHK